MKMNVKSVLAGSFMAAAVAGLFATTVVSSANANEPATTDTTAKAMVKCEGINECKGKGMCKSATNDCKGKNECKGKGMMEVAAEKDCTDKKGKVSK